MPLLEIREVSRRFGDLLPLDRVSLSIESGEFFTLLGPSGSGKTTLLRLIAGFDEPDEGSPWLDGQPLAGIPPECRPVHTVFQSYALFPHMSVAQNVAFPLRMSRVEPGEIHERVAEALSMVRLSERGHVWPRELSGGQQQRVAIARALVGKPRLLLLDEPLAALDAKLRLEMQIELIRLQREVGITFIFVTHAQDEDTLPVPPHRRDECRPHRAGGRAGSTLLRATQPLRIGLHRHQKLPAGRGASRAERAGSRPAAPEAGRAGRSIG